MVKISVIHSVLLSAVIFGVLIAIFTMVFPRNIIAQTLHDQSLGEIIKQEVPKSIPQIDTDIEAGEMEINGDRLYVSNSEPGTISVISTENNTKIKDIEVGGFPSVINDKIACGHHNINFSGD